MNVATQNPLCRANTLYMWSRLLWTLSSGSLAFRSHLFTEWYEDRIQPFVHYLPVCAPRLPVRWRIDVWAGAPCNVHGPARRGGSVRS
jgi:hypothetical protein